MTERELMDEEMPFEGSEWRVYSFYRHVQFGADAQARKMVEWMTTEDAYGLAQRMISRDDWQELRRQVGLE